MKTVNTLTEAMSFFLENSSGSVICKSNGGIKECNSYPEAEAFFLTFTPSFDSSIDPVTAYSPVDNLEDSKVYVAYGFAYSGLYSSLARIASTKDGGLLDWELTSIANESVGYSVERISSIVGDNVVAVDVRGLGCEINQVLALKVKVINVPVRLDSLVTVKHTLEESLLEKLTASNPQSLNHLNLIKGSRSASANADYKAILAAYSIIANPPQPKAEKDEYIEIKGDGYYIKFKVSDLNCGKGIDYNVETGQLIISKLPDDVVEQLKDIFSDVNLNVSENVRSVTQAIAPLFNAFNGGYDKGYADALEELSVNLNKESTPTQIFELKELFNKDK